MQLIVVPAQVKQFASHYKSQVCANALKYRPEGQVRQKVAESAQVAQELLHYEQVTPFSE